MSPPVTSQPLSEAVHGFHELLLLLDPRWHNLLFLDDFIHEVLGRVQERTAGGIVSFYVDAFASVDVPELTSRYCILDSFVRKRCQALKSCRHGSCTRLESVFQFLLELLPFFIAHALLLQ